MASSLEMVFRKARSAEKRGDEAEARRLLTDVLERHPRNVTARQALDRLDRGTAGVGGGRVRTEDLVAAYTRGDHEETIRIGDALIRADPSRPGVRSLTGAARLAIGANAEAEADFRAEVLAQPRDGARHARLGAALIRLERFDEGEAALSEALRLEPDNVDALFNRIVLHEAREQCDAAIEACGAMVAIVPGHVGALHKAGRLHAQAGRHSEASFRFLEALAADPEHVPSLMQLGHSMMALSRFEEASNAFRLAARVAPDDTDAHINLGIVLGLMRRTEDAIVAFAHAAGLAPKNYGIWARLLSLQGYLCDWSNRQVLPLLPLDVEFGSVPFDALPFEDDAHRQLRRSKAYAQHNHEGKAVPLAPPSRAPNGKIRVGYFSADFHNHAVYYLIAGLLREHDRSRFEIYCYDFSPLGAADTDVPGHVDTFVSIRDMGARDVLDLVRGHELDIAVDLMGYTRSARTELFAARLAPVQINYLGYPGSMGLGTMDYIVGDPVVIPAGLEDGYSEAIIRLPGSYQPNDDRRAIVECGDTRENLGLPAQGFVFCCFNQNYKISPREYDIWMRLLREVEGSVLWLLNGGDTAEANLRREAGARGVDPARLIFAPNRPHHQHLARLRHADLFLDTFCYNAHTTASDALWGGLPVLTRIGHQFAARVGASLVTAMGLPDCVANDDESYYEKALELARSPAEVAQLRERIAANRLTHPLFDTKTYARDIERAYTLVHERRLAGLAPELIDVR